MKVITSPVEIQILAQQYKSKGLTIGLVPTMGWFHEGHLSLMREAKSKADKVIVTLFVNPIQFGPSEDFDNYPHDLSRDCKLAEETGVDVIFAPDKNDMYADGFSSTLSVSGLTSTLCGANRPGHFDGVTTVVAKLFNLTLPNIAVFGKKDFQQLAVIRKMVRDFDFPIEIIAHRIVREVNGMAMSSRNTYLKDDEIKAALSLSQSIKAAKEAIQQNTGLQLTIDQIKNLVSGTILAHDECSVDYIEIVHEETLKPCTFVDNDSILVLAVKINDRIRLIDNSILIGS